MVQLQISSNQLVIVLSFSCFHAVIYDHILRITVLNLSIDEADLSLILSIILVFVVSCFFPVISFFLLYFSEIIFIFSL